MRENCALQVAATPSEFDRLLDAYELAEGTS
jgi:hypothetical protein